MVNRTILSVLIAFVSGVSLTAYFVPRGISSSSITEDRVYHWSKRLTTKTIHCNIYDFTRTTNDRLECVDMKTVPRTPVCIYPDRIDNAISYYIRHQGVWEGHILRMFQSELQKYPFAMVLDIGANIGVYSLLAARMGHMAVAVEPSTANIEHLHRAARLGASESRITLLQNGVSDERTLAFIQHSADNQGNTRLVRDQKRCNHSCAGTVRFIQLDDIVEVIPESNRHAIMKMDIQGHEHLAFQHASKLFDRLYIPVVFMEWYEMKLLPQKGNTTDVTRVNELIKFFFDRGYRPYDAIGSQTKHLQVDNWKEWPFDVVWRKL